MPIFVIQTSEDASYFPIQNGNRANVFVVVAEDQLSAINLVNERGDNGTEIVEVVGPIEDEGEKVVESFTFAQ